MIDLTTDDSNPKNKQPTVEDAPESETEGKDDKGTCLKIDVLSVFIIRRPILRARLRKFRPRFHNNDTKETLNTFFSTIYYQMESELLFMNIANSTNNIALSSLASRLHTAVLALIKLLIVHEAISYNQSNNYLT